MLLRILKNKETLLQEKTVAVLQEKTFKNKAPQKQIQSVAILTTVPILEKHNLKELVENYINIKNPKLYCFRTFTKGQMPSLEFFSEKDFTRRGTVLHADFNRFLKTPSDLLLTITNTKNVYVEYATAITEATCKVGFAKVNASLFNLEVHTKITAIDEFLLETKRYLQILGKLPKDKN